MALSGPIGGSKKIRATEEKTQKLVNDKTNTKLKLYKEENIIIEAECVIKIKPFGAIHTSSDQLCPSSSILIPSHLECLGKFISSVTRDVALTSWLLSSRLDGITAALISRLVPTTHTRPPTQLCVCVWTHTQWSLPNSSGISDCGNSFARFSIRGARLCDMSLN